MRLAGLLFAIGVLHAQVTLLPMRPLDSQGVCIVGTTTLPNGLVGAAYSQTLLSLNCTSPVTWDLAAGSMCSGMALQSSGAIVGTPTILQTCSFTARATDASASVATQVLSITIGLAGVTMGGTAKSGGKAVAK